MTLRGSLRVLLVILLVAGGSAFRQAGSVMAWSRGDGLGDQQEEEAAPKVYGETPEELLPFRKTANPYRRFFLSALEYRGPAREKAEPTQVDSVPIGLLAPLAGVDDAPAGTALERGVELALEEANAAGGYSGAPFTLVAKNDQQLWGASSNTLVEFAYVDKVWALIGSIDSTSTHVALRAALKAELAMVNVGSTDPTVTETGIPWLLRVTPDDRQAGYRLARYVFEERGFDRVAVIRSSDRYGRVGVKEFRDAARRLGRPLPMEELVEPLQTDFTPRLRRVASTGVDAVVLWTKGKQAALILNQMRSNGMAQPVIGTDRMVTREFLEIAGRNAEGVTATSWMDMNRQDRPLAEFRERFRARFEEEPDVFAIYGYDAARIVIKAIREVGLNRARIRDALMSLRTYEGVSGSLRFDETSNNIVPQRLARVSGGRFVFN